MAFHLTTPLMRGTRVRNAQQTLSKNPYGKFFTDEVDGVYGQLTAQATYRAKYWLGYPTKYLNQSYGNVLRDYLIEKKKLPVTYKARRKLRQRKAAKTPTRLKAFNLAVSQVGIKESPAKSNIVKYSKWYGLTGPWCAMFTSWCYSQVGRKTRYAYVPYVVHDARAGRNKLTITKNPVKGDLVCFDFNADGVADHIGFFDSWQDGSRYTFTTVEGNTGIGNEANGGAVMRRERRIHQVQAFVRVG